MSDTTRTGGFVHLHVHTEYSGLDGMTRVGDAADKVAADGQPAIAITDHGTLGGAWAMKAAAQKAGVKPLIGVEAYLAVMTDWRDEPDRTQKQNVEVDRDDESAVDDDVDERGGSQKSAKKLKKYEHLTLFAYTEQGWTNLATIMDIAEESGFHAKPRIDYQLLKEYHEGILVLTGCLGGPILGPISRGAVDQADRNMERIIDAVGKDNVYVEIMEHGIAVESNALPAMVEFARKWDLPLVATNDSHYTNAEDHETHEAWLAVQSGRALTDPKRFQFHGRGYHIRTEQEMRALRSEDWWQEACDNTVKVAERFADNVLPTPSLHLPQFPVPAEFKDSEEFLWSLALEGAKNRYGDPVPDEVIDRLKIEIGIISDAGFCDYFLIMRDLVDWARNDGNLPDWEHIDGGILVGPGRGSAAGSVLSYVLEIVDIDPLEHNLLFERFMEPGRPDYPDIDSDFEQRYVNRVRAYLAHRWGHDKVARIGTHNVAQTKAAIKDAARVLDLPAVGNRLSKAVPDFNTFKDLDDPTNQGTEKFRSELEAIGPDGDRVVDLARRIEGTLKGEGIHACGIIVSDVPLRGLIPLRRDRSKSTSGGLKTITAWDAPDIGDISGGGVGLLKLDILSIRNLDIVSQAIDFIEQTTGERLDARKLPHPDTKGDPKVNNTWSLLKAGRSSGLFQMDSSGMQNMARSIAPDSWADLSAILALFRPGPLGAGMDQQFADRKAGIAKIDYDQFTLDPGEQEVIASVLGETYGVWCIAEGQRVWSVTQSAYVPIEDIAVGELVQGVTPEGNYVAAPVTAAKMTGIRPTVKLAFANGRTLQLTTDHQVLTVRGWIQAGDLTTDDVIASPWSLLEGEQTASTAAEEDLAALTGYLIGDGGFTTGTVSFFNQEHSLHEEVVRIAKANFSDLTVQTSEQVRGVRRTKLSGPRTHGGKPGSNPSQIVEYFRSVGLLAGRGGCHSRDKFIPEWIMKSSPSVHARVLAALWDTDGTVSQRGHRRPAVAFKTISKRLADDVMTLLHRRGITTTVTRSAYVNPTGAREVAFQVGVLDIVEFRNFVARHLRHEGKSERLRSVPDVLPSRSGGSRVSKSEVVAFQARLEASWRAAGVKKSWKGWLKENGYTYNPAGNRRAQPNVGAQVISHLAAASGDDRLSELAGSRWLKVNSITEAPVTPVYDISVDEVHNFVAEGVVVHNCFQEQLMRLGASMSGFDAKKRSKLRKAVGKKDIKVFEEVATMFIDGAVQELRDEDGNVTKIAFQRETAQRVIDAMRASASYLFNASHSAAYAQLAFVTAYLKANWPAEYGAAVLSTTSADDKRLAAMAALESEGITILPPDVNRSQRITSPEGGAVRLGLTEIKGVGQLGDDVVDARDRAGVPFDSFGSLVYRLSDVAEKKTPSIAAIEGLVEAGACDEFGPRLGQLMIARAVKHRPSLPVPDAEFGVLERSIRQRARLGVNLGEHPLSTLSDQVRNWSMPGASEDKEELRIRRRVGGAHAIPISKIPDRNGEDVLTAGLLAKWTETAYSRGRRANITLEGSSVSIEGVLWDDALKAVKEVPPVGSVVAVYATVSMREREIRDEDDELIETVTTKEITVRRLYPIPVFDPAFGSFLEQQKAAGMTNMSVPVMPLLKLMKPKAAKAKPPAAPARGGVVNHSVEPPTEPEPVYPAEPAYEYESVPEWAIPDDIPESVPDYDEATVEAASALEAEFHGAVESEPAADPDVFELELMTIEPDEDHDEEELDEDELVYRALLGKVKAPAPVKQQIVMPKQDTDDDFFGGFVFGKPRVVKPAATSS
ncbi:DNA polymerase III subunit alpha [Agromyces humi]|uniref:DNA polymerase III subunit alpha n=1 Tax=Agromyces humi TaxID=1766800 RepID=UPI00135C2057|nr:DNA polymerase III subunit alpha [Agromyces humi]